MHPFEYDVSLRIRHPKISPNEICSELGIQAEFKWGKGEQRKTSTGLILEGIYEETYCCFKLYPSKDIDLADFLKECNKKFSHNRDYFEKIRLTGGEIEYFIGWYSNNNSGEIFDLDLLAQMVNLKINFAIDFYNSETKPRKGSLIQRLF